MRKQISKAIKITEIADYLGGKIKGNERITIRSFKPLHTASKDDLSFFHKKKYLKSAITSKAGAIIVDNISILENKTLIVVENASESYRRAIELFYPEAASPIGVSSKSIVDNTVEIGEDSYVGSGAIISSEVKIGKCVKIMPGAIINECCVIGDYSTIHSGAILYPKVIIGKRVTIHSNAVIGSDGFGFHRLPNGKLERIPQVGQVIIEDDVEIGACTCVDCATLDKTIVKIGSKIDNLVLVGHNVEIGNDCLIIGQSGIAGSSKIGAFSELYGQSCVRGHLELGEKTRVLMRGGVVNNTKPNSIVAGFPALPDKQWRKIVTIIKKLPELYYKLRKYGE